MKRKILFIVRVFATLGIFFVLYKLIPYRKLISAFQSVRPGYVAAGFFCILLGNVLGALRWRYLLLRLSVPLTVREALYIFFSGTFFNMFFPSFVAGDAFRGVALSARFKNTQKAVFSVLMDRISGLIAVSILTVAAFINAGRFVPGKDVFAGVAVLVLATAVMLAVIFHRGILEKLAGIFRRSPRVYEQVAAFLELFPGLRRDPRVFAALVFCFSLPIQLLTCVSYVFLAKSFSLPGAMSVFFVLVPLAMVVAFLPVTVAGIGTRDLATVYLFSKVGISRAVSLGMSLMNLMFMIGVCLIGGFVYVVVYHRWLERSSSGSGA